MKNKENVLILGAGLCGSLLALRLGQRGYNVNVYEQRPDLRTEDISAGRSINLAFSDRGIKAMRMVGIQDKVEPLCNQVGQGAGGQEYPEKGPVRC